MDSSIDLSSAINDPSKTESMLHTSGRTMLWKGAREKFFYQSPLCLIAAIATEHDALLVHNDRDFLPLAQLAPKQSVHPVQRRR